MLLRVLQLKVIYQCIHGFGPYSSALRLTYDNHCIPFHHNEVTMEPVSRLPCKIWRVNG